MNTLSLTAKDIAKIEEGMNTEDVEHMVAIVDRIVLTKLLKIRTPHKKHKKPQALAKAETSVS